MPNQQRLDSGVPIHVLDAFGLVNVALLELLKGFSADDWNRPTVHQERSVKDLAAHLLHGSLRRVTGKRDHYRPPAPQKFASAQELTQFIQADNRAFMNGMSQVSPQIIIELIAYYDPEVIRLFKSLDLAGPGMGVVWAGEWQSANWFDIAREYTEKWHHQQQLRDATDRPSLYDEKLLKPVLETFARGLPFAYRSFQAPAGTSISILVNDFAGLAWTLRRQDEGWSLWSGADERAETVITASADRLWRVWTKGIHPSNAMDSIHIRGNPSAAEPLLQFVAIMA